MVGHLCGRGGIRFLFWSGFHPARFGRHSNDYRFRFFMDGAVARSSEHVGSWHRDTLPRHGNLLLLACSVSWC